MKRFTIALALLSSHALADQLYYFEYKSGMGGRYEFVDPSQGNECRPSKYDSVYVAMNAISYNMRACNMMVAGYEPVKEKNTDKWNFVTLAFRCSGYQDIIELHKDKAKCSQSLKESREGALQKSGR